MKIDVIGSGCSWTKELSSSYIIDNTLMFDAPEGSFKTLYLNYDLFKIRNIIISHMHNDHFVSLHIILNVLYDFEMKNKINILAPSDCKEKLIQLVKCVNEDYLISYIDKYINFISCEDEKEIKLGDYFITPYKMLHSKIESYGFIIRKGNIKVGFSGDTAMCDGIHKILEQVSHIFIDSSNVKKDDKHLTIYEVLELSKKYKNVKFHPIHLSKVARLNIDKSLKPPKQGEVIYIKK